MHAQRPISSRECARTSESGFGRIELLTIVLLVAIIGAVVLLSARGANGSSYESETKRVALEYQRAVSQFQSDNDNANPAAGDMGAGSLGPLNELEGNRPYIGAVPDGVEGGRVAVSMAPTCAGPGSGSYGWVTYCPDPAAPHGSSYIVQVWTRASPSNAWPDSPTCYVGNAASDPRFPAAPRC